MYGPYLPLSTSIIWLSELNVLIDSIFKHTVSDLPKLYPAIKRGQPVKTKFILPILISTTD